MQYLGFGFSLLVLFVNLWGLTLLTGLYWRNRWLALSAGPWLWATAIYAIECYHGLGRIQWLGLVSTLVSLVIIVFVHNNYEPTRLSPSKRQSLADWRREFGGGRTLVCLGAFAVIFGYGMLWRFAFPNVDGSSEKLADFSYICSYFPGGTIPVRDAWLSPFLSTQYYSFQHYGGALLGRMMGWPTGTTYNIALCVLIGLIGASFAGVVWETTVRKWVRGLVIAGFVLGGSGVTGIVHLIEKSAEPWVSMRFIGSAPHDGAPLGNFIKEYAAKFPRMDLPGEPFSYSIYLGDFHPPLSGYYLLALVALAMLVWQIYRQRRYAFLVGATLTWTVLANTWSLPLQVLGIAAWVVTNRRSWREILVPLFAGAAAIWMAAWVYLSVFADQSVEYKTAIRLVPWGWTEHTPPLLFLMFLFPTIMLAVLGLCSGHKTGRWMGLLWIGFLFVSEFVYVDDVYSGMYNRFNTTLKWWPWIAAGALMTLGPVVLERPTKRWVRWLAVLVCGYPCLYAVDLGRHWWEAQKEAMGQMEGVQFLTKDLFPKLMLGRMKVEKPGVVLERPQKEGFTNSACLPLFAGHRLWTGWVGHEMLWHGYRDDIPARQDRSFQFFNGEMKDPAPWLLAQNIDYILWYQVPDTIELWNKINPLLSNDFYWCEVYLHPDGRKVGFWRPKIPHPDYTR